MDDVFRAISQVCKVAAAASLLLLVASTYWLRTHGLPYHQFGLVAVTFTLSMVVLITVVDALRLPMLPPDCRSLGADETR
ncbi:hypothetical protein IB260_00145 [Pseudomonas sp. PDM23]|uniref:hypothetical protein n=1 Tax=unclassified Pseudomonas TaxID=196821 RepID=UPI00177B84FD|nr:MULTISPECIES: hypothetical protein [unclassified Pseudomonas]MBD9573706.1 hypothetical protein [Pseudomonas sp. PDM23]MBD9671543.1 hypothetical protein [Pseudomonas sp. PDM21]